MSRTECSINVNLRVRTEPLLEAMQRIVELCDWIKDGGDPSHPPTVAVQRQLKEVISEIQDISRLALLASMQDEADIPRMVTK